jgi:membrane protein required for beta-lactamase induction
VEPVVALPVAEEQAEPVAQVAHLVKAAGSLVAQAALLVVAVLAVVKPLAPLVVPVASP